MNWVLAGDLEDLLNHAVLLDVGVIMCLAHFLVPLCIFAMCAFGPFHVCVLITKENGGIITDPLSLLSFLPVSPSRDDSTVCWSVVLLVSLHTVYLFTRPHSLHTNCPAPYSSSSLPLVVTLTKHWHVPGEAKCFCLHVETVVGLRYKPTKGSAMK